MAANSYVRVTELDFDEIKNNIKTFLRAQTQFSDYDFEGSNLSVLIDLLAYNTHYNAILANMAANEMFIDTAIKRNSVASLAKHLGYTPTSRRCARAKIGIAVSNIVNGPNFATLDRYKRFTTVVNDTSYTFYNINSFSTVPLNGVYVFDEVEILQGRQLDYYWTVPNDISPATKFVIPNQDIDLSTLQISVQYGGTGSYSEPYQPMQDITRLDETSKVYFVEENGEGYYQVYFGDGVLGYNLTPGDIVRARYLVTDGAAGNFSNLLTLTWNTDAILGETSLDRYIATISAPTGGQDAETTDQIKFHARNSYVSGNRTVTETDFANAIKDALPGLQSVSVWGGENSSPPRYGTVFISAKPYTGYVLTDAEKIKLVTDVLRPRSVVGLQYAFVDPEYTYIGVDVYLKYRTANTSRSAEQISALALQTVTNYFDNQLEKFNAGFYNSQLQEEIQNMDASIVSNILVLRQQKRIAPIPGTPFNVKLQFPGKIHPAELVSTYFYYYNGSNYYVAYIADAPDTSPPQYEGTGTINLYDAANNTIIDTLGTVSYGQAQVSINNLNISGYINDSVIRISTNLQETSRDLQPQYNEILVLDDTRGNGATAAINGVSVNVVSANI